MLKKSILPLLGTALCLFSGCAGRGVSTPSDNQIRYGEGIAEVKTAFGTVAGYEQGGLYIFKGIEYAEADRFMPPHDPSRWDGVKTVRAYGPVSPQSHHVISADSDEFAFNWTDGYMGEDCLRLNIWTKGINDGGKRPVMVWIHGGGFSAGNGQHLPCYDGSAAAKKGDVVTVTLNHRLNCVGFLDLSSFGEKYRYSGNVGILDIIAALKWIKGNIASFGGDPDNVMIYGQSGGGGKISTLMVAPSAAGLFHKAAIQSGSTLALMESKYSSRIGELTVKNLGLDAAHVDEMSEIPYEKIAEASEAAVREVRPQADADGFSCFIFGLGPTVDGDFLPMQPSEGLRSGMSKDIPLLLGTNLNEFSVRAGMTYDNLTPEKLREMLLPRYGDDTDAYMAEYRRAYPSCEDRDLLETDYMFRGFAVEQADLKASQGGAPVFRYEFDFKSKAQGGMFRCPHNMELAFVHGNVEVQFGLTGDGPAERELADKMSTAWINFAKTGTPSAPGLPEWPSYDTANGATMIFDTECSVTRNHDRALLGIASRHPVRMF